MTPGCGCGPWNETSGQTMATCEKSSAGPGSSVAVCCPICYREYSDSDSDLVPRILHCGHSFCTECLQRLLEVEGEESDDGWRESDDLFSFLASSRRGSDLRSVLHTTLLGREIQRHSPRSAANEVTCPVCKRSNHIQDGEVTSLTKNFALLGIHEGVERVTNSQHYCQEHDHEQRIFCQDCQELVCAYCQLYGRHKNHKCLIAAEACQPAVEAVGDIHAEVELELQELKQVEAAVLASVQQLERGKECSERIISQYYNHLIETLQQKSAAEVEQVQAWTDEQAYVLQSQLRSLSAARKTCTRLLDDCRKITDYDPLQALNEQQSLATRAEVIKTTCKGLPHEPIITPSVHTVQQPGSAEHLQALMNTLTVRLSLDPADQKQQQQQQEEEEEEERLASSTEMIGSLLHAQDTQHTVGQSGVTFIDVDSVVPVDPSPSLASPITSTPASYLATPQYSDTTLPLYPSHSYSPASSNSEDSTGEEYKALMLPRPLSFLMTPSSYYTMPRHRLSHDEAAELADDESEQELILDQSYHVSPPSPPSSLPVPSIPPATGLFTSSLSQPGEGMTMSIAGRDLHISVSGSTWPHLSPSTPDNGEAIHVEDSD